MQQTYIVSAVRTPTGKAPRGQLSGIRPDELAAVASQRLPGAIAVSG